MDVLAGVVLGILLAGAGAWTWYHMTETPQERAKRVKREGEQRVMRKRKALNAANGAG